MPKTMQGPAIFLAQFAGDEAPFDSWAAITRRRFGSSSATRIYFCAIVAWVWRSYLEQATRRAFGE